MLTPKKRPGTALLENPSLKYPEMATFPHPGQYFTVTKKPVRPEHV
jgi:hypothetical protein